MRTIKVEIDLTDDKVDTLLDTLLELGAANILVESDGRAMLVQGVQHGL